MNTKENMSESQTPVAEKVKNIMDFLQGQSGNNAEALELQDAFTEAMVVVSATSGRHAQGLADGVARLCAEKNYEFLGMEGYENAQWILADCNDLVVHIFQEDVRDLYKLEELWARSVQSR